MPARSTVVYSVLRLLAFLVPFGLLMLLPAFQNFVWLAAIFAALIGLAISILFLRRPLEDMSAGIAERRAQRTRDLTDEEIEDAAPDDR